MLTKTLRLIAIAAMLAAAGTVTACDQATPKGYVNPNPPAAAPAAPTKAAAPAMPAAVAEVTPPPCGGKVQDKCMQQAAPAKPAAKKK